MGNDHRLDTVGGGRTRQGQTHTQCRHSVHRDTQGGWSLGQGSNGILTHESVALPQIKYRWSLNIGSTLWGVGEAGNIKHTHTHTHSVPRDTQGGWNLGQRSDATLTHVGVAPTNSINGL